MNSCGIEISRILKNFIDLDNIESAINAYNFSVWYPSIAGVISTPTSFILPQSSLLNNTCDNIINLLGGKCFARLDRCSAKPEFSYSNSKEIIEDLKRSDRTNEYYKKGMDIVIREWLPNILCEFRCFVFDDKLRGISVGNDDTDLQWNDKVKEKLDMIKSIILIISRDCQYEDFTADFCFNINKNQEIVLTLIEINTPVYLCASSGKFDLEQGYDYNVLLGDYDKDLIDYPVIL